MTTHSLRKLFNPRRRADFYWSNEGAAKYGYALYRLRRGGVVKVYSVVDAGEPTELCWKDAVCIARNVTGTFIRRVAGTESTPWDFDEVKR